jgi:hypothetical protein
MIPPVIKSLSVPWPPAAAFRRWTAEVHTWWPMRTHSVGQDATEHVVFTPAVGGTIHEVVRGGAQHVWGTVLGWDPPRSVRYTWHPGEPATEGQEVEVRFEPEGTGTRIVLTHSGWERKGAKGARYARMYRLGWSYVLALYQGRRTLLVLTLDVLGGILRRLAPRRPAAPTGSS